MFVIEVIPLVRGTQLETLSYYSSISFEIGTILSVPIRNTLTRAMVATVHSVSDSKSTLRSAAFTLKKLPPQTHITTVPENIRVTATTLMLHYPASVGAILYHLLPPEVRRGEYEFPLVSHFKHNEDTTPRVLTARKEERYIAYRSHIRSVLAKRGSVMVVVPTMTAVTEAIKELSIGITDRIVSFTTDQSKRERVAAYQSFEDTSLAKVIITTPSHAYLDRVDLLAIILEEEASEYYTDRVRPYIDHRFALAIHAAATGRSLLLGDILPRTETERARRQDRFLTHTEETKRHSFATPFSIINQKRQTTTAETFSLFSTELRKRINDTLVSRGQVFLYGARRGLAPMVMCNDCGFIFRCLDSGAPYSLLRTHSAQGNEERWFISTTSGKRVRAADTCTQCGSWRLREQGIGIQTIFSECEKLFPDTTCILFDHQTANTKKRAETLLTQFQSARSAIMAGTHIALPYIAQCGVDVAGIVSLDALRATPTWRADEQTLRLLLTLRDCARKEVLVQTRTADDPLLSIAQSGLIETFYHEEIALREQLAYPPFARFILVSWQGTAEQVAKVETEVQKRVSGFSPTYYSHPLSNATKTVRHALFRIPNQDKRLPELIDTLRNFPPYIKIEIDPSRIV